MALGELPPDLPRYDCEDFRTDFKPKRGPGFFPGTDGHFHGCSAGGSRRIVFFGTDFGPERYWNDEVTDGLGEKPTQRTLRNLRRLVEEAGVDPCSCYLTNSVLALAKNGPKPTGAKDRPPMTGNEKVYAQHPKYLQRCAAFHEEWISRNSPRLVVLMGRPNLETYCRHVFHSIFPILKTCWRGLGAPWECMYESGKELVRTRPGEPDVLWMFHPSYRHANPQFRQAGTPDERRRRREQVWTATIEHLGRYR